MWPKFKHSRIPGYGGMLPVLLMVVLALFAISAPTSAAAAEPETSELWNLFGTQYGDAYSSVFLNQLFGPLFPSANGTEVTSVFPMIIGYFNVIILIIGGLMFFYNVTVGVMQSAHEGVVLGQRWSSLWGPLRVIIAVGMLVPVNEGYNLAQTGVAYLVKGSTNMASQVWSSAATLVLSGEAPIAGVPSSFPPSLVRSMYSNAACMVAFNNEAVDGQTVRYVASSEGANGIPDLPEMQMSMGDDFNLGNAVRNYNADQISMNSAVVTDGEISEMNVCGSYQTPATPLYITRLIDEYGSGTPGYDEAISLRTEFVAGHTAIMDALHDDMTALAQEVYTSVKGNENAPAVDIAAGVADAHKAANASLAELNSKLLTEVKGSTSVRDALSDRISGGDGCTNSISDNGEAGVREGATTCYGEGWMGAGSWYILMARLNNEINTLLMATPSATSPNYDSAAFGTDTNSFMAFLFGADDAVELKGGSTTQEIAKNLLRMEEAFDTATVRLAALGYSVPVETMGELAQAGGDGALSKIPGLQNMMFSASKGMMDMFDPAKNGQDPMIGLIGTGNLLLKLAGFLFAGIVAAGALGVGPVGIMIGNLAMFLKPIFSVLLASGGALSFILPMMPFLYWVLAVSGYFLLIFEAIVAVNLWALSHLRMDGDGFSGEAGRQGWLMVLALFMTPTLMVFGFLIGMAIFRVVSDLLSAGMFYAVSSIIGSSLMAWMFGLVAYTILMVTSYIFLLERSFSLVSEFPNRVMKWMGSQVEIGGGEGRIAAAAGAATLGVNHMGNAMEAHAGERKDGVDENGQTTHQFTGLMGKARGGRERGMAFLNRMRRR